MATVLVHNETHSDETTARAALRSKSAVRAAYWWNIWRVRQAPFGTLDEGSPVVLLDSWRGGGLLSWVVEAVDVHTEVFRDKSEAVRAIARWAGEHHRWPLKDPYTDQRHESAGVVIYWRARPIARIDVPRPPQLVLRRNGWCVTDEEELASWGVVLPTRTTRGRSTSRER